MLQEFCTRAEATHLSLYGVCGAIANINKCKVTGMVPWPKNALKNLRLLAERAGKRHDKVF